jgi:hypothetical protein
LNFSSLACSFAGAAFTLFAIWLIVRRGIGQLAAAHTYRSVAEKLGLQPDTRGSSLHGFINGRRLWVGPQTRRTGPQRLVATVALAQPLGIGLVVQRESQWNHYKRFVSSLRAEPSTWKRPNILSVSSSFPQVANAILDESTKQILYEMASRWPGLRINDYAVRINLVNPIILQSTLHQLVLDLCHIANTLEKRRIISQPPPYAAALSSDWNRIAQPRNLRMEPNGPVIFGNLGSAVIAIAPNAHGRSATINVVREMPNDIGLLISDQRRADVENIAGQDILVGDGLFDDAFIIKGYDPDQIRTLLDLSTREAILRLKQISRVRIDDHALTLRNISVSTTVIDAAIDDLLAINSRLDTLLS